MRIRDQTTFYIYIFKNVRISRSSDILARTAENSTEVCIQASDRNGEIKEIIFFGEILIRETEAARILNCRD